jgi:hypothetical protein
MPNIQEDLHNLRGSEDFVTLDYCQGKWQIPLHKDSQDCPSFITPDKVFTPTRVLHKKRNATQHLDSALVVKMDVINSNINVRSNDCLLYTKTKGDLLAALSFFLKQIQKCILKLHASTCVLFAIIF